MTSDPTAAYPSLTALSKAFGQRTLKPSEVVDAQLARIAALDPALGSYQAVYAEDAMQAAKAADAAIASGHRIGPFHGISFALKDIFDVESRVTACGSLALQNRTSERSGTLVRRLIAAGGILLGKTKTVECALGGWGTIGTYLAHLTLFEHIVERWAHNSSAAFLILQDDTQLAPRWLPSCRRSWRQM